uniref:Store-operated calcium entry-associated regulatory factor n=1 Tax=Heligmosomoides polygyrus TaxID=6339 RepID=A0A183G6J2_HELPZ
LTLRMFDLISKPPSVLSRVSGSILVREGGGFSGRRSAPVPQLKCVGGSARGRFKPRAAQCFKQGYDGIDYQWKCTADMPSEYEFGAVTVTCEGFDYPEDPYILQGSCGVSRSQFTVANVCICAFILYVLYTMISNSRGGAPRTAPRHGGFGGGFDGGPGFGGGYPGHPPPSAPPPSYDDTMGFKNVPPTGAAASSGPGFWTGAGLGALGGYLFGRNA